MKDLLLIGGGGHCKAVIDVIELSGNWRIAGIVERVNESDHDVMGYPIVGHDEQLEALSARYSYALVTVGQIKSAAIRERLFLTLLHLGFNAPVIVSPLARVARSARLGSGTVVMHQAVIGPDACVGANVIVNTHALVEHDAEVGDHCHIATAAVLNGHVKVGPYSMIGSGSLCREGISIGDNCLIGMGSVVRHSIHAGTVFLGREAR
jgi:sugar O-acyltransferase (sialic acid O-acetyltransferase NeuD family)